MRGINLAVPGTTGEGHKTHGVRGTNLAVPGNPGEGKTQTNDLGWLKSVPHRLHSRLTQETLTTEPSDYGLPEGPIVLLLYAGPDNHTSLEMEIQRSTPWMTPYIVSLDILRDKQRHDMLHGQLYTHLCNKATKGNILAITGGPNCRTWSILLHKPQQDGTPGHPLRGRHEPHCWGFSDLTTKNREKTDDDSILLLRMLIIYDISRGAGYDPAFLLEHPADPADHSDEPTAHLCCSIWSTDALLSFSEKHGLMWATFPQCFLGQNNGAK